MAGAAENFYLEQILASIIGENILGGQIYL